MFVQQRVKRIETLLHDHFTTTSTTTTTTTDTDSSNDDDDEEEETIEYVSRLEIKLQLWKLLLDNLTYSSWGEKIMKQKRKKKRNKKGNKTIDIG